MRIFSFTIMLLFLSFHPVFAQDTITVYYNSNWDETLNKDKASYYRKAYQDSAKLWTVTDYYLSNRVQMTGSFTNKKFYVKQGHFTYYYENGRKSSEGNYYYDNKDGRWNSWHENGELESEGVFKSGMKHGTWTYWHGNGKRKSTGKYVNNLAEDRWQYWFETGEKESEGFTIHGRKDGTWRYFYKNGEIEAMEQYKESMLKTISGFFENGNQKYKVNCTNGKGDGEWTYWNIDGLLFLKGNITNDKRVGEWIRYFPNGESMKIFFENGVMESKQLGGIYKN